MKRNKLILFLPLIVGSTLAIGILIGNALTWDEDEMYGISSKQSSKVQEILQIVDQIYVDSVDAEKLFEESLSDMLHRLDPHSNYISASDVKLAEESIQGQFEGIGVRFYIIRDTICITNVIPYSPSERAGLMAGDRIVKVGNENVAGVKIKNEDVMSKLKGPGGTKVNLIVLRNGKNLAKMVIRGIIPTESVVAPYMINGETGYIKINSFSINTHQEFVAAAKILKNKGMKKLVLDLRNNGGGALESATKIADEFLSDGQLILMTKGRAFQQEEYRAHAKGILEDTKVCVLINFNSASASEILAGALQDNDRAIIVGRRSFGKGLVQQDAQLKDGSRLRLTIARYYTPTGRSIQREYDGDYQKYTMDYYDRIENGELYHIDSSIFKNAPKKITPGGKTVYGGGGIMPDIFVPYDTVGISNYFSELSYSDAFVTFAFDYVQGKRSNWATPAKFISDFKVSDALLNSFVEYAEKQMSIPKMESNLKHSKELIKNTIKAEIARQLFIESGLFQVLNATDNEVRAAVNALR